MLKYQLYLKRHAAGMKREHQSLASVMMAHVYNMGRLENREQTDQGTPTGDKTPVWPDIEFVLYAQKSTVNLCWKTSKDLHRVQKISLCL
jgi:hypothetical protein